MTTVIIDYGSGNLRSAAKAFERAAREAGADGRVLVTNHADSLRDASRVVLPGVGAFADCRRGLAAVPGMEEALRQVVLRDGRPFLGICVGMQLLAERGREFETVDGLGWIKGEVGPLTPRDSSLEDPSYGLESSCNSANRTRSSKGSRTAPTPISCIPMRWRRPIKMT